MEGTLLIFVPVITPRIKYVFSLFFDSLIATPYSITDNTNEYIAYTGPKLSYSKDNIELSGLVFAASGLLSEKGIRQHNTDIIEWKGLKTFFPVNGGTLPFDIFSASFYLVSRYEEYLIEAKDAHKRFRAQDSLAFKYSFINTPLVNLWAEELKKILLARYPNLKITANKYRYVPTIDIDVAYAHLGRKPKIIIGSYLLALSKLKLSYLAEKTLTLLRLAKDKYDTYDYQQALFKKYNLRPVYFFLAAGNRSKYDKNISTASRRFSGLVKKVAKYADVGIHPSYQSHNRPETVENEIKRVEKPLGKKITASRQHFLRVNFPETYRCLAQLNITDDYTLAYAACPGFRASICTPFLFYDIEAETTLPVKIHSTIVMDGTLKEYMQVTPDDAITIIHKLISEVKNCSGEFVSIWHNHSLAEKGSWEGWRRVFEFMTEKAA